MNASGFIVDDYVLLSVYIFSFSFRGFVQIQYSLFIDEFVNSFYNRSQVRKFWIFLS